jgi:hypothetical protein
MMRPNFPPLPLTQWAFYASKRFSGKVEVCTGVAWETLSSEEARRLAKNLNDAADAAEPRKPDDENGAET